MKGLQRIMLFTASFDALWCMYHRGTVLSGDKKSSTIFSLRTAKHKQLKYMYICGYSSGVLLGNRFKWKLIEGLPYKDQCLSQDRKKLTKLWTIVGKAADAAGGPLLQGAIPGLKKFYIHWVYEVLHVCPKIWHFCILDRKRQRSVKHTNWCFLWNYSLRILW